MHETRNFILVIALVLFGVWAVIALIFGEGMAFVVWQRIAALVLFAGCGAWLVYALKFEDKLPNHLKETLGGIYYEVDGLSFMPIIRCNGKQAEISVYYQNRFENPAETVVHLRPPEDCFVIRPGMRDVHFTFKAAGGDFGVIHQPISASATRS